MVIGGDTLYVVQRGDCLISIGGKLGVNWATIAEQNCIDINERLKIGEQLLANTRRIVPRIVSEGIIINIPVAMLYYFKKGNLTALPVGLGKSDKKCRTPVGKFKITDKAKDPVWRVPLSIQEEMRMNGDPVETFREPSAEASLSLFGLPTGQEERAENLSPCPVV